MKCATCLLYCYKWYLCNIFSLFTNPNVFTEPVHTEFDFFGAVILKCFDQYLAEPQSLYLFYEHFSVGDTIKAIL